MSTRARRSSAAGVVAGLLLVCVGVNLAEFARVESTMPDGWRAVAPEQPGNIERPSFSYDRYALYYAIRAHTSSPVIITSEPQRTNVPGRLLGLGDASRLAVADFDDADVRATLDLSAHVVAEGPYSDAAGHFWLLVLDESTTGLVLLRNPDAEEIVAVDLRLIPEPFRSQIAGSMR